MTVAAYSYEPAELFVRRSAHRALATVVELPPSVARARRMRRLVPSLFGLSLLVGTWFGADALVSSRSTYTVRSGDTLSSIAARIAPARDVSAVVVALRRELGPAPIFPGEQIELPARHG